jgi:hypothetical protein
MRTKGDTVSYTAEELAALRGRGGDHTDAARVEAMTDEDIQRDLTADPDWKDVPADWYEHAQLETGIPHSCPPVKVPNALTARTLRKSERGEDLTRLGSAEELFKALKI